LDCSDSNEKRYLIFVKDRKYVTTRSHDQEDHDLNIRSREEKSRTIETIIQITLKYSYLVALISRIEISFEVPKYLQGTESLLIG